MKALLLMSILATGTCFPPTLPPSLQVRDADPSETQIQAAFARQGIRLTVAEAGLIRPQVRLALEEARRNGPGSSKVGFSAVEIARDLRLDTGAGSVAVQHVEAALRGLVVRPGEWLDRRQGPVPLAWEAYFDQTLNLARRSEFLSLLQERGYHPVKISWEDIGRYENSAWGDRISDVGIWVRRRESDPASAELALSVRRDSNFRDRVLMVPADRIKVHLRQGGRLVERSLPERLRELGLASQTRDRHVIVSNQFALVPVPSRDMAGAWPQGHPPRAAFTFSIFPYGSSNYVITDVIEGSHEAVVGPGGHQLLFANEGGQRAPFTASRAADRPDLQRLEQDLRAQGMDADVQRYYLIQIPLRRHAPGLRSSGMGTPPLGPGAWMGSGVAMAAPMAVPDAVGAGPVKSKEEGWRNRAPEASGGLDKVAIGTGETEGPYCGGAGFRGARAEEPIRVTVVYFVTPQGRISRRDMDTFAQAFGRWDAEAIWGGSFVVKDGKN